MLQHLASQHPKMAKMVDKVPSMVGPRASALMLAPRSSQDSTGLALEAEDRSKQWSRVAMFLGQAAKVYLHSAVHAVIGVRRVGSLYSCCVCHSGEKSRLPVGGTLQWEAWQLCHRRARHDICGAITVAACFAVCSTFFFFFFFFFYK
jgi:hypothetical protein